MSGLFWGDFGIFLVHGTLIVAILRDINDTVSQKKGVTETPPGIKVVIRRGV